MQSAEEGGVSPLFQEETNGRSNGNRLKRNSITFLSTIYTPTTVGREGMYVVGSMCGSIILWKMAVIVPRNFKLLEEVPPPLPLPFPYTYPFHCHSLHSLFLSHHSFSCVLVGSKWEGNRGYEHKYGSCGSCMSFISSSPSWPTSLSFTCHRMIFSSQNGMLLS